MYTTLIFLSRNRRTLAASKVGFIAHYTTQEQLKSLHSLIKNSARPRGQRASGMWLEGANRVSPPTDYRDYRRDVNFHPIVLRHHLSIHCKMSLIIIK